MTSPRDSIASASISRHRRRQMIGRCVPRCCGRYGSISFPGSPIGRRRSLRWWSVPRAAGNRPSSTRWQAGCQRGGRSPADNHRACGLVSRGQRRPLPRAVRRVIRCLGRTAAHGGGLGRSHLLHHLSVVDAPDFDSVVGRHREMAEELLAAADVAVFVASAQRYADAVPWEFLEQLKRRDLTTVLVLNRVTLGRRACSTITHGC